MIHIDENFWSSDNGGHLSISHQSRPDRPIWSTIPGQAFVSAALAETEVEESRGSFVVKDGDVHLVCNNQTIEEIRVINHSNHSLEAKDQDSPSGYLGFEQKIDLNGTQSPVLHLGILADPLYLQLYSLLQLVRRRKKK